MNEPETTDTTEPTDRPTVELTANAEGHPVTPKAEGGPPRAKGIVTDRLRREREIRDQLARRRFPNISAKEAQTVCLIRRDFQEKVYGKRGKVRGEAGDA